jgi:hypothetical protein
MSGSSPGSGPGPQPGGEPPPPAAAVDDLDQIRSRVAALESAGPPHRHRARTAGSVVVIAVAAVLSLLSVVAVWADSIVDDPDRYVATVAPLAHDPAVQDAVTRRVTDVVLAQIDVPALVGELSSAAAAKGVPPRAADLINRLSGPINSGLESLVGDTVHKVVTSSTFATVWTEANRAAHTALNKALTGQGGGVVVLQGDRVTVDVAPIIARVKQELTTSGFALASRIPEVHTGFVVFESKDVARIRTYMRLLQLAGGWLPVVAVLVAAVGVFLAVNRRRALVGAALAVAAAMLLLGILLTAFRAIYLDHLPPDASQDAAAAVYDAMVRFLRAGVRAVGALALVTALGAFLVGPSRPAVATRTACRRGIGALRGAAMPSGTGLGAVGRFVHRWKRWIGAAILAVAAVVLFTWSYPTAVVVLWIVAAVLAAFAIREFLDPGPETARPLGTPTDGTASPSASTPGRPREGDPDASGDR